MRILVVLSEGLLHPMPTVCTSPSTRKVSIDYIRLDILIPKIHTLRNFPDKVIVAQIVKDFESITGEAKKGRY